jgi:hypothetical protein
MRSLLDFLLKKYSKSPILAFLSYSSEDKILAGEIKEVLESYWNFSIFLAHEDLDPGVEWESEILRNLHNCEVFMPLITVNFSKSHWTDQESGIAFSKGKIILPICTPGLPPYGFIKRYQAFFYQDSRGLFDQAMRIVEILEEKSSFKKRILEGAVVALENSKSFEMTRRITKFLNSRFGAISQDHFRRIQIAQVNNGQVRGEMFGFPAFFRKMEQKFKR